VSILPTFCLLSVTGSPRMSADTLARNADKIDTFRRPPMSANVQDQSSHGENRGSSPLGSAILAIKLLIFVSSSGVFATLSDSGLPLLFADCL
jgi:hypothetical protein